MLARAADRPASCRSAARRVAGTGISSAPERYWPVSDAGLRAISSGVPAGHQFAAQPARARAEIDHVIGALDGLGIVLHHQHGVAHVAQLRQGFEQAVVVARMQADGRLVQHVEHAAQLRADLRGQADALRFAAGERGGGAVQAQVIQPDGGEKLQAAADFVQHAARDLRSRAR